MSYESSTLVGDGEGVSGVSQGEPLMQEKRDQERKTCIGDIRMEEGAIASESMDVSEAERNRLFQSEYQNIAEHVNLDAETFIHPLFAY